MMRNYLELTDRVAVVIGATSGIGRTLALGLACHGANVVPTGRREDAVACVCREIELAGRRTLAQATDITSRQSIEELRDRVMEHFGRVDILVNAAGITFLRPTLDVAESEWNELFDTNLTGALRAEMCAQANHARGKEMQLAAHLVPAEQQHREKAGFQEKCEDAFRRQRAAKHVADITRIRRPICAEFKLHH